MSVQAPSRRVGHRSPIPEANTRVAEIFDQVATILEVQEASPFRVRAYRRGAATLRRERRDVADILAAEGLSGLEALTDIGRSLAGAAAEVVETGRLALLDRLRGATAPEDLFASLPGVGPTLAHRLHARLGVETLEDLEVAAWDGRLARVPGFGPRRVEGLVALLDARLSRSRRRRRVKRLGPDAAPSDPEEDAPPASYVLSVDGEYRAGAEAGALPLIAPRRFNPRRTAWLPVLHTERGPWAFHAFFSNTALAHRLGRTRDWVVIYYERDGREGQCTVVTETRGALTGRRVIRGREAETPGLGWTGVGG